MLDTTNTLGGMSVAQRSIKVYFIIQQSEQHKVDNNSSITNRSVAAVRPYIRSIIWLCMVSYGQSAAMR